MIGASTAPDRLGLSDSPAAARHERDARPSMCTSHARACDRMIAPSRRSHSVTITECDRHESRMVACHTETCEVHCGSFRRSQRRHVSGKVPGRDGGERACRRRRSDAGTRTRAAWPVAERHSGAVSGRWHDREKARDGITTFCHANDSPTKATSHHFSAAPGIILVIAALSIIHCHTFGGNDDEREHSAFFVA